MYVPPHFTETDRTRLVALMRQRSFAMLTTVAEGEPFVSHLPLWWEDDGSAHGRLIGHMARANPQWRHFATMDSGGQKVLAVFAGPHAYISPSWYDSTAQVPTWNYGAVHAYGTPRIVDDPTAVLGILQKLVGIYESGFEQPWRMDGLPEGYAERLSKAIVAFELPIERIEGKWKLGQNKSAADRMGTAVALERLGGEDNLAIAAATRATL
ncbi:MAG: FMN-binding negative transcriptional regulator [Rhodospirillales bacterium]